MSDTNIVSIVGRLVRDPELKYTNDGSPILKFSIASSTYQGQGKEDYVNYFDVSIWGKQGESLANFLRQGKQVSVTGNLKQDRWDQDGQTRTKVRIKARNIQMLGKKDDGLRDASGQVQGGQQQNQGNYQQNRGNQGSNQGNHGNSRGNQGQQQGFQGQGFNGQQRSNFQSEGNMQYGGPENFEDDIPF